MGVRCVDQDGRVVKALDLSSNGRIVRVGSNPTPGIILPFILTHWNLKSKLTSVFTDRK